MSRDRTNLFSTPGPTVFRHAGAAATLEWLTRVEIAAIDGADRVIVHAHATSRDSVMAVTMHSISVPVFVRMLNNTLAWIDKAEAHARARKFDANTYLSMRLTPGMLPLSAQIQIATDHVKGCLARLAGIEPPKWADDETTLDELRARVRKAIEYAESIPAAKLEGSDGREIELPVGGGRTMKFTGEMFLKGFSLPNFFFHVTITYALLRQGGVEIGKMDYLGAP